MRLGELERLLGENVIEDLVGAAIAGRRMPAPQRRRILSCPFTIRLIIAMTLMPDAGYAEAACRLAGHLLFRLIRRPPVRPAAGPGRLTIAAGQPGNRQERRRPDRPGPRPVERAPARGVTWAIAISRHRIPTPEYPATRSTGDSGVTAPRPGMYTQSPWCCCPRESR